MPAEEEYVEEVAIFLTTQKSILKALTMIIVQYCHRDKQSNHVAKYSAMKLIHAYSDSIINTQQIIDD